MLKLVLSLLAGAILPLAFAPYGMWPLAMVSCILFLYSLERPRQNLLKKTAKQANTFWPGFLYGLGSLGFGVSWVFNSIYDFSGINLIIAIITTLAFISFFALLSGLWSYSYQRLFKSNTLNTLLAFPLLGVMSEWLRSNIFSGFPWLLYGYSQIDSPLRNLATVFGVYGLSLAVLIISAAFYLYSKRIIVANTLAIGIIALLSTILANWHFISKTSQEFDIAICQSNLNPQQQAGAYGSVEATWELYSKQVVQNLDKDLIIWPESSIPVPLPYSQNFIEYLNALGQEHQLAIIVGILQQAPEQPRDYFNGLIVTGNGSGTYYKHHLVPFGEYLPFKKLLTPLLTMLNAPISSIMPSESKQLVKIPGLQLIPAICYEITFADFMRQAINKYNAHVIVNISEDGWFGDSLGPHQHLEIARMRALENGVYVLRSTPTGLSAIIDYNGHVIAQAQQFTETFVAGKIFQLHGHTPWTKFGQWPTLISMLATLLWLIFRKQPSIRKY